MIVLDASVLIALLSPFDVHHDDANRMLLDEAHGPMVVHTLTLAEVLVGGVRSGRSTELRAGMAGAGIQLASWDEDEPLRLAELRVRTGLKLPGCCVLDTAISNGARLATFDLRLARAAVGLGVPTLP